MCNFNIFVFPRIPFDDKMNEIICALVKIINENDVIFTIINKAFCVQMFFLIMHILLMGISTMFLLAHKITSHENIFDDDSPIIAYLVCVLYLHLKIAQISFISYRADQKVSILLRKYL